MFHLTIDSLVRMYCFTLRSTSSLRFWAPTPSLAPSQQRCCSSARANAKRRKIPCLLQLAIAINVVVYSLMLTNESEGRRRSSETGEPTPPIGFIGNRNKGSRRRLARHPGMPLSRAQTKQHHIIHLATLPVFWEPRMRRDAMKR